MSILNSKNFEAFNGKENVHFPVPVSPWDLSLIENKMRLWWAVFVLLKVDIKMVHFHSLWLQGERIRILWCSYWRPQNQETVLVLGLVSKINCFWDFWQIMHEVLKMAYVCRYQIREVNFIETYYSCDIISSHVVNLPPSLCILYFPVSHYMTYSRYLTPEGTFTKINKLQLRLIIQKIEFLWWLFCRWVDLDL